MPTVTMIVAERAPLSLWSWSITLAASLFFTSVVTSSDRE